AGGLIARALPQAQWPMEDLSQAGEFARLRSMHPQSEHYFVTAWPDSGATFVRCHAVETDFANQTTAARIVTVPASKPNKEIAGSSTNAIVLLRDKSASRNTKCLLRARRAIGGNQGKMVAHAVTFEPVSAAAIPC